MKFLLVTILATMAMALSSQLVEAGEIRVRLQIPNFGTKVVYVDEGESVEKLRELAARNEHIDPERIELIHKDRTMEGGRRRLWDYYLREDSDVDVKIHPQIGGLSKINVLQATDLYNQVDVMINLASSVGALKDEIAYNTGVPASGQTLHFKGQLLEDEEQLEKRGLEHGSTVFLTKKEIKLPSEIVSETSE